VRLGLGYVNGVRADEVAALVAARDEDGEFRDVSDVAARAGAGRPSLELLAWAGACDGLAGGRRPALWQLGVAAWRPEEGRRVRGGTQLALPFEAPPAPALRDLDDWETLLADYGSTGVALRHHPLELLRAHLPADTVDSRDLATLPHGSRVRVGGLVVARQRPATANGMVFILLEDEHGTINLVVPPPVYDRHRMAARTEPLVIAEGKLERPAIAEGGISVLIDSVRPIDPPDRPSAVVKDFSPLDERERQRIANDEDEVVAADFRAVAPAVQSFASGRRR
jgi:error-prone DNA polymerase